MTSPIIDLLLTQADSHRETNAIIDGTRTMSYAELEHASRQWACRFEALGIGPGDCVLVFVPPSKWLRRRTRGPMPKEKLETGKRLCFVALRKYWII